VWVITSSKVPKAIVNKRNVALAEAPKSPHVSQRLAGDGATPVGNTTEQFNAHIRSEITK